MFQISRDLLGSGDHEGYFTALNAAWETKLGFSREALMAQRLVDFVHPADRAATLAEMKRFAEEGIATLDFENRYAVKDGGWCWLSWRVAVHDGGFYFIASESPRGSQPSSAAIYSITSWHRRRDPDRPTASSPPGIGPRSRFTAIPPRRRSVGRWSS